MDIIVFDLEWNQACSKNLVVENLTGEIIQISAVKINPKGDVTDLLALDIKAKYYKTMNKYVKKLTKITNKDLKFGLDGINALKIFKDWCGDDFRLVSWGPDDKRILTQNYDIYNIDSSWIGEVYNAQLIFSKDGLPCNLEDALSFFDIEAVNFHNAFSDSFGAAKILKKIGINKLNKELLCIMK